LEEAPAAAVLGPSSAANPGSTDLPLLHPPLEAPASAALALVVPASPGFLADLFLFHLLVKAADTAEAAEAGFQPTYQMAVMSWLTLPHVIPFPLIVSLWIAAESQGRTGRDEAGRKNGRSPPSAYFHRQDVFSGNQRKARGSQRRGVAQPTSPRRLAGTKPQPKNSVQGKGKHPQRLCLLTRPESEVHGAMLASAKTSQLPDSEARRS
jgi:hypothetical protein